MYAIGNSFIILGSVDSTNNYAMAMVHAGLAKHGDVYFSTAQRAGKGQRGRVWESAIGQNIALSCIIEPREFSLNEQFLLNVIIALSCYDFVSRYTRSECSVKWPNDIYWRDRKAGGILIENSIRGSEWQYAVAGIGLNINQVTFSPELINPVSLKQITGNSYDLEKLAKELCSDIQGRLNSYSGNTQTLMAEFNDHLYKIGEKVILKTRDMVFETVIKGIDSDGKLITFRNGEELFHLGEIEWVK